MAQVVSALTWLAIIAAGLGGFTGHAHACGGLYCFPGTFHPAMGTVPSNLKGIYWWPSRHWDEDGGGEVPEERLRLARVDGSEPQLIAFTLESASNDAAGGALLIVPETPFVAGASYVAWDLGCDEAFRADTPPPVPTAPGVNHAYPFLADVEWSVARFSVTEAAPLPTELGALLVSAQRDTDVWVYEGASCTTTIDVIARDITLELSANASPWADALFYRSLMDGDPYEPQGGAQVDPYPGTAMAGRARELIYARCDAEEPLGPGITPGTRRVELRAHVPGEVNELATEEVSATLACSSASDAGSDAAIDGGGHTGDGDGDSGPQEPPAGDGDGDGAGDGDRDDDDLEVETTDEPGDGCDCSATGARGSSSALWIACAVLWLARRRALIAR